MTEFTLCNKNTKLKAWVFTWNNYQPTDWQMLVDVAPTYFSYIVMAKEVAPTTGTPHIQGYFELKTAKSWTTLRNLFHEKPWLQPAAGQAKAQQAYIMKAGGETFQMGEPYDRRKVNMSNGDKQADKWHEIRDLLDAGNVEAVRQKYPQEFMRNNLVRYAKIPHADQVPVCALWLFGEPHTGKTYLAQKIGEEMDGPHGWYDKTHNKWWDGYTGQKVVIVNDLSRDSKMGVNHLKIWADTYRFPAEVKGGMMVIRPEVIIVTSNCSIREMYGHCGEQHIKALESRFRVHHFTKAWTGPSMRRAPLKASSDVLKMLKATEMEPERRAEDNPVFKRQKCSRTSSASSSSSSGLLQPSPTRGGTPLEERPEWERPLEPVVSKFANLVRKMAEPGYEYRPETGGEDIE